MRDLGLKCNILCKNASLGLLFPQFAPSGESGDSSETSAVKKTSDNDPKAYDSEDIVMEEEGFADKESSFTGFHENGTHKYIYEK